MRPLTAASLTLALLVPSVSAQAQQAAGDTAALDVADAVVTTAVDDRQPADTLSTVPADVGRVFLWTRVTGAEGETRVAHVWHHGGEERARVELRVASPDWRTWSSKRILPSWTGAWRVEVTGPGGEVLETVSFTVE